MQFTPKTEKEIARDNAFPDGWYPFEVYSAEEKVSRNGNEMIVLALKAFHEERTLLVNAFIMANRLDLILSFCNATGLRARYDSGNLTPADMEGRSGWVRLTINNKGDFEGQNSVRSFSADDPKKPSDGPAKKPFKASTEEDDGIPF